jgi:hypothetical protein
LFPCCPCFFAALVSHWVGLPILTILFSFNWFRFFSQSASSDWGGHITSWLFFHLGCLSRNLPHPWLLIFQFILESYKVYNFGYQGRVNGLIKLFVLTMVLLLIWRQLNNSIM